MEDIKKQLENLKAETKKSIIEMAKQSCEVEMCGLQIRQSFSYYDEEVYHLERVYIDPVKGLVRAQLSEYADSIPLEEFSIEDQIGIYEELHRVFSNPKYNYRIDY